MTASIEEEPHRYGALTLPERLERFKVAAATLGDISVQQTHGPGEAFPLLDTGEEMRVPPKLVRALITAPGPTELKKFWKRLEIQEKGNRLH